MSFDPRPLLQIPYELTAYIFHLLARTGKFHCRLSWQRYGETCCVGRMNASFVYRHASEVDKGIYSDSTNFGGACIKGSGSDGTVDNEDGTAASVMCCAWWRLL
jgi:hypothetical protein